jgi:hypothetical protein
MHKQNITFNGKKYTQLVSGESNSEIKPEQDKKETLANRMELGSIGFKDPLKSVKMNEAQKN